MHFQSPDFAGIYFNKFTEKCARFQQAHNGKYYGKMTPLFAAIVNANWVAVNTLFDYGAGIGVDLDNLPNRELIESKHYSFNGALTWDERLAELLQKVATIGVVIGLTIQGKPVSNATPGFKNAITNLDELRTTLFSQTRVFDYPTLLKIVREQINLQQDNRMLLQLQRMLLVHSPTGLTHTCLEWLNSNRSYKQQALKSELPEHLKDEMSTDETGFQKK